MNQVFAAVCLSLLLALCARAELDPVPFTIPGSGLGLILTADLDNDGVADVVDRHDNKIYWRKNLRVDSLGQNPLSTPQQLSTIQLDFLQIADMDSDGDRDFIGRIRNYPANDNIVWVKNLLIETGAVSFETTPRVISSYSSDIRALFIADLDLDGRPDPVSCDYFGSERYYWHQNRIGVAAPDFAAPGLLISKTGRYNTPHTVDFGDIDNDGDMDVATRVSDFTRDPWSRIVWLENSLIKNSGFSLRIFDGLTGLHQIPAVAVQSADITVARINGEIWFQIKPAGASAVDYRETALTGSHQKIEDLKNAIEPFWTSGPDSFQANLLKNRVTAITRHPTGGAVAFTLRDIYGAILQPPGQSLRHYTPDYFALRDLDQDGDLDLFTSYPYVSGYGALSGWYENRLNDPSSAIIGGLQKIDFVPSAAECLLLEDIDGNGGCDIVYLEWENIRVKYNFLKERREWVPWHETAFARAFYPYTNGAVMDIAATDLDGDGDSDLLHGYTYYSTTSLRVSENLSEKTSRARFRRDGIVLVPSINGLVDFKALLRGDPDSDGDDDLYLAPQQTSQKTLVYRNAYNETPGYSFVEDSALGGVGTGPGATSVTAQFQSWLAGLAWTRLDTTLNPVEADFDLDGDVDIALVHTQGDAAGVVWFENTRNENGGFKGPHGVAGGINPSPMIASDFDQDGDPDLLVFAKYSTSPTIGQAILAFENQTIRDTIDTLLEDDRGYFKHGRNDAAMLCTLQITENLDWAAATNISVDGATLGNKARLKEIMQWLNPAYPRRFYRMIYRFDAAP